MGTLPCSSECSRPPDDLYKNGIQRQSFVPCIHLIKDRFEVIDLDSGLGACSQGRITKPEAELDSEQTTARSLERRGKSTFRPSIKKQETSWITTMMTSCQVPVCSMTTLSQFGADPSPSLNRPPRTVAWLGSRSKSCALGR